VSSELGSDIIENGVTGLLATFGLVLGGVLAAVAFIVAIVGALLVFLKKTVVKCSSCGFQSEV